MPTRILYVERRPDEFVSIEKAFRQIARALPREFETDFQAVPYGHRLGDIVRNLLRFRARPADLTHVTGHVHYMTLVLPRETTILSVMDVRFLDHPSRVRRSVLKKLFLDWPVRRARVITAISEATRQAILAHTRCDPRKVRVLELPLLDHFDRAAAPSRPFDADRPVILQVGTMANKNLPRLIDAIAGLRCRLRVVGRLNAEQTSQLRARAIDYEALAALTDEQQRDAYATSDLVTFCSTLEGFGLPVIEAQAMGKPVVTSDISPLREVSGGAAVLVDPRDVASIRAGIARVIDDPAGREALVARGLANVERFRPDVVARQYAALYRELLGRA